MEQIPKYSSSAPTKPSPLEGYQIGEAKADLRKILGTDLPPPIDFTPKASKGVGNLAGSRSTEQSPDAATSRNSSSHDPLGNMSLKDEAKMGDDAAKLLSDYTSSFNTRAQKLICCIINYLKAGIQVSLETAAP
ncbi:uncharacterized protein PV07_08108 [Cladophialophora immunda]|uniref:Uncharacterized protein n=1 Tax=Cladophialophora immunda TaxID=569365 RepID=A0A0D2ATD8_9EURO|nr:uncharacterized protein PV07_08108 [Cladophialophora immunda]KIW28442.1 hypothetical protein PV07_08108 [Cladophialophora immunda]